MKQKRVLKIELALFFMLVLVLGKRMEDEPAETVKTKEFVMSFVTGSDSLLQKSAVTPLPTVSPTPLPTLLPTSLPTPVPQTVESAGAAAANLPSLFSPATYPKLSDVVGIKHGMEELLSLDYLRENLYIVNATTKMTCQDFDVKKFLEMDLSIEKKEGPQILIYHTHGSEAFADSKKGTVEDTVIGMGEVLKLYLEQKYEVEVLHDTTVFDRKNGKDNRDQAYNDALVYMEKLLKQYPSVEVIIDLHRDAGTKRVATIQGKKVAKVMLFNGLCRNTKGKLDYLPNENLTENLAFSFQMKLFGDEMYPGLMNRIFLKDYRYNMHLVERYLLIELGTVENTTEEARNAMEPLADVLAHTLGLKAKNVTERR